jgi:hypothetical protein
MKNALFSAPTWRMTVSSAELREAAVALGVPPCDAALARLVPNAVKTAMETAGVIRDYGMHEREGAPADNRRIHG